MTQPNGINVYNIILYRNYFHYEPTTIVSDWEVIIITYTYIMIYVLIEPEISL